MAINNSGIRNFKPPCIKGSPLFDSSKDGRKNPIFALNQRFYRKLGRGPSYHEFSKEPGLLSWGSCRAAFLISQGTGGANRNFGKFVRRIFSEVSLGGKVLTIKSMPSFKKVCLEVETSPLGIFSFLVATNPWMHVGKDRVLFRVLQETSEISVVAKSLQGADNIYSLSDSVLLNGWDFSKDIEIPDDPMYGPGETVKTIKFASQGVRPDIPRGANAFEQVITDMIPFDGFRDSKGVCLTGGEHLIKGIYENFPGYLRKNWENIPTDVEFDLLVSPLGSLIYLSQDLCNPAWEAASDIDVGIYCFPSRTLSEKEEGELSFLAFLGKNTPSILPSNERINFVSMPGQVLCPDLSLLDSAQRGKFWRYNIPNAFNFFNPRRTYYGGKRAIEIAKSILSGHEEQLLKQFEITAAQPIACPEFEYNNPNFTVKNIKLTTQLAWLLGYEKWRRFFSEISIAAAAGKAINFPVLYEGYQRFVDGIGAAEYYTGPQEDRLDKKFPKVFLKNIRRFAERLLHEGRFFNFYELR